MGLRPRLDGGVVRQHRAVFQPQGRYRAPRVDGAKRGPQLLAGGQVHLYRAVANALLRQDDARTPGAGCGGTVVEGDHRGSR